ncbi:hypothetical protein M9H77_01732 [Catharanthus roseus]|uniref:Uncharacterized protein n=1 Tax=Catharanthus roseus TaxID=4058 RepID=A0ACC0C6I6_CATRO|nr:hypothetical protein M9H77_01732 [Catharanthus roseus]
MEEYRQSFRSAGGDRRLEIVSGKGFGASGNQVHSMSGPRTPDPPQVTRGNNAAAASYSKPWSFNDPEMKRKKRIAKYKVYTIEAKKKLLTEKKEKKVMLCNGKGIGATPPGRPINGYCDKRKRRWSNAALSLTQILYLVRSSTWYF